jgi:glucose/arabinose dehydrogenase
MSLRSLLLLAAPTALATFAAGQQLTLELVTSEIAQPLDLAAPEGDFERIFIAERGSTGGPPPTVRIVRDGALLPLPFLDLSGKVLFGAESGLLGLAFHPDYLANGRFFVNYTGIGGFTVVEEYAVSSDPDVADPDPVQTIFTQAQPATNHNGGRIAFAPDGSFYIAVGDGGEHAAAQDGLSHLGKMIRLDVNLPPPFVPPDNPFVGDTTVSDLVWALGLRNPWRFSFDRGTGDLWITDVGVTIEEINFQPASSTGGNNYGWSCTQGTSCTGGNTCVCGDSGLTPPIYVADHSGGNGAVIGGFVYRGSAIPELHGTYLFGDFFGQTFSFRFEGGQVVDLAERTAELTPPENPNSLLYSLGEDAAGELYLLFPYTGVYRIVRDCSTAHYCSTSPNSVGPGAQIGSIGSTSVGANDFAVRVGLCPPAQFGLFFYGPEQVQLPFGDGSRCVGAGSSGIFRLGPAQLTNGVGGAQRPVRFDEPPADSGPGQIEPGSAWNFQFWYRDPAAAGSGFNLSNALSALFCP